MSVVKITEALEVKDEKEIANNKIKLSRNNFFILIPPEG